MDKQNRTEYYLAIKINEMVQYMDKPQKHQVIEVQNKRILILLLHFEEMSRKSKFTERKQMSGSLGLELGTKIDCK